MLNRLSGWERAGGFVALASSYGVNAPTTADLELPGSHLAWSWGEMCTGSADQLKEPDRVPRGE